MKQKITISDLQISENFHYDVLTEKDAKLTLSKVGLDYTYLNHLFIKVEVENDNSNNHFFIKQLNFDAFVAEIKKRKELEKNLVFKKGW